MIDTDMVIFIPPFEAQSTGEKVDMTSTYVWLGFIFVLTCALIITGCGFSIFLVVKLFYRKYNNSGADNVGKSENIENVVDKKITISELNNLQ